MTQPPPGWQPPPGQEPAPGGQPPSGWQPQSGPQSSHGPQSYGPQSSYGQEAPRYPGLPPQADPNAGLADRMDQYSQWGADKRLYFNNPVFWGGLLFILAIVLFTFFFVA